MKVANPLNGTENSPVNSAMALKNRPLSVMVTGKGTVLQKAKVRHVARMHAVLIMAIIICPWPMAYLKLLVFWKEIYKDKDKPSSGAYFSIFVLQEWEKKGAS